MTGYLIVFILGTLCGWIPALVVVRVMSRRIAKQAFDQGVRAGKDSYYAQE